MINLSKESIIISNWYFMLKIKNNKLLKYIDQNKGTQKRKTEIIF